MIPSRGSRASNHGRPPVYLNVISVQNTVITTVNMSINIIYARALLSGSPFALNGPDNSIWAKRTPRGRHANALFERLGLQMCIRVAIFYFANHHRRLRIFITSTDVCVGARVGIDMCQSPRRKVVECKFVRAGALFRFHIIKMWSFFRFNSMIIILF